MFIKKINLRKWLLDLEGKPLVFLTHAIAYQPITNLSLCKKRKPIGKLSDFVNYKIFLILEEKLYLE